MLFSGFLYRSFSVSFGHEEKNPLWIGASTLRSLQLVVVTRVHSTLHSTHTNCVFICANLGQGLKHWTTRNNLSLTWIVNFVFYIFRFGEKTLPLQLKFVFFICFLCQALLPISNGKIYFAFSVGACNVFIDFLLASETEIASEPYFTDGFSTDCMCVIVYYLSVERWSVMYELV